MKNILLLFILSLAFSASAQKVKTDQKPLPKGFAPGERALMKDYLQSIQNLSAACITTPPSGTNMRSIAEWEELQALVITWTSFREILTEIVRHAREEVEVIIICNDAEDVKGELTDAGVDWSTNVTFIEDTYNSIWIRDYGPNSVYLDDVGELASVDWIYNRPRPLDDKVPEVVADYLGIDNYCTSQFPADLVHTGGNYMTDGLGTAFSSKLVLDENGPTNEWGTSNHSPEEVFQIMDDFMGIQTYPLMEPLPYDVIHHIDMHMKMLDEKTLLVGQYPEGRADGPQIEANIQYLLNNYTTAYGEPFKIVRIPMPPDNGEYPDVWWADYRTYANAVFVNKTILVPFYEEQYDTTAQRIWEENMPGYNVVGIDCNDIIPSLGALHCITKEVGVHEPLWITTNKIDAGCTGTGSMVEAQIKHHSGIAEASVFYKTTSTDWTSVAMNNTTGDLWSAEIPEFSEGTEVSYYITSSADDGKTITRPLPGAAGAFSFVVESCTVSASELENTSTQLEPIFPNPASAITCIPVHSAQSVKGSLEMTDVLGRRVATLFSGQIPAGASKYFINAENYQPGTYFILLQTETETLTQKLIIQ